MSNELPQGVFRTPVPAKRLRIYLRESDRYHGLPLYEAVVEKALELHMAGATVFRGPMAFGTSGHIHTAKILRLSENLPFVIEIVDSAEKLDVLMLQLETMIHHGLVTIEDVGIAIHNTPRDSGSAGR